MELLYGIYGLAIAFIIVITSIIIGLIYIIKASDIMLTKANELLKLVKHLISTFRKLKQTFKSLAKMINNGHHKK